MIMASKEEVIEILKQVYDPELQVDIWSLGLVYDIKIEGSKITIIMTLTSPVCPYGPELMNDVRRKVSTAEGISEVGIELTFNPVWGTDKMSEEAKIALGI